MSRPPFLLLAALCLALTSAGASAQPARDPGTLVEAARSQVGVTVVYDPAYVGLAYPMGDVPADRGVCTDVVIRAFRQAWRLDLQQLVHEDMAASFSAYPKNWGLKKTDRNIDHRRVPNLMTFFRRRGWSLPVSDNPTAFRPGDLVTWDLRPGLPHIGIVSDRQTATGIPLIVHNIGSGTREEDLLFTYKITGHFRPK